MPLNRYQIRNEYSLADPELYKVADKDDPEALLEGVAMAGLVGVLRQLGDLAEFAAEIFHDLHEEVMATAARGHGLIIRTQQLEAEFPSIERTLLSQTSHTAFLYNSGVEWHPNPRMDQSVVTQGDLPRFVMDSYEECRGPPRLFLLDKFDVAGAGACLKRFTDPSFFKMESTSLIGRKFEGQREKKTRRLKKRGPRWKNGDTPESFPSSHAKLHQLFLEERIESGINDPARRVKLKKRQFTGSLFEQDNVRSYMEQFLDAGPHEQKILHEICIDPLPLTWKSEDPCESGLEIVEIGTISPVKESIQIDKSLSLSSDVSEMYVKQSIDDIYQDKNLTSHGESLEVHGLHHEGHDGSMSYIPMVSSGDEIADSESIADRESKLEVSVDGDSDDVASETDNYVDALANMESEFETDSESKKFASHLNLHPNVADSDGSEKQLGLKSFSMDSHSVGNSVISEDNENFSRERECSSCSNSLTSLSKTTSALDSTSLPTLANATTEVSNAGADNMYFVHYSTEEIVKKEREKHAASSSIHAEVDGILNSEQMFREATITSSHADLSKKVACSVMEDNLEEKPMVMPEDSGKYDGSLGESNQENKNRIATLHSHGTFSDTFEDDGLTFCAEPPIFNKGDSDMNLCSDDGLAYFPKANTHNNSSSSFNEAHDKNLAKANMDACSYNDSSIEHLLSSDSLHPDKMNSVDVAREGDICISSTQEMSNDLCCASDSSVSLGIQDLFHETTNHGHTSTLDVAAESIQYSWHDPSMKFMSDYALHVGQAENLLGSSNQLQTPTCKFSSFDNTEAAEITEVNSSEADVAAIPFSNGSNREISRSDDEKFVTDSHTVKKASPVVDSFEILHESLEIPSKDTDITSDVHQDVVWEQISGNQIGTREVELDVLMVDPASQTTVFHEANNDHAPADYHGNQDNIFIQDTSTNILLENADHSESVTATENDSDTNVDGEKVGHIQTANDLGQAVSNDNGSHQSSSTPLVSVSQPEKLVEQLVLVSEDFHQNEDDLTENHVDELTERRQVDLVRDASVAFTAGVSNLSPDEHHSTSHDNTLLKDVKNIENISAEGVSASVNSRELLDSNSSKGVSSGEHSLGTSSLVFHDSSLLGGDKQVILEENSGHSSLSQQGFPDVGKPLAEARINPEPPSLPPLPPMQWRLGRFQNSTTATERQSFPSTLIPVQVQPMSLPNMQYAFAPVPSMAPLAMHHALSSYQPVTLQAGNNTLGALHPAALPTSVPVAQHTFASLHPVTLSTGINGTETVAQSFTSEGLLGYSDGYVAQQGVFALPMPVGGSEGFFQITSSAGRQDNRLLTVPLSSSALNGYVTQQGIFPLSVPAIVSEGSFLSNTSAVGTQDNMSFVATSGSTSSFNSAPFSVESHHTNLDPPESDPLVEGHFSENASAVEVKVNNGTALQHEILGPCQEMPEEEAENLNVVPTVDQPPPGLMAPDTGRTWSSAYDEATTEANDNANGTLQKKLPRPRNPLIDEVVAIDKSKLRKVERSKPLLQSKLEGGESILEQMQLRKVERIKPPAESKVGGEKVLEQLQLRKVGDRAKLPVEQKAEERDFLVEHLQLRKVGERVKPPIEPKPEENEFLLEQMQLRKVKAKAKEDVEPKAEEIESPVSHLKKVSERCKKEVELRIEDSDSPRMQLRKVTERANPQVAQKTEERDSLFEQIRNKAFNLKPAVAALPNVQGPRTNLKVAAILEKASTIRQAMVGSDEDDDADSWSDDS